MFAPRRTHGVPKQGGFSLLEALISILIFSFGILGLVGLQATAMRTTTDARYRSEASYLVDSYISQMWSVPTANVAAQFGPSSANFTAWKTQIAGVLPNTTGANAPVVTITAPGLSANSVSVVVTTSWQLPGEATAHRFTQTAEIGVN
jgi:type IV pilus assembly protein PilV